MCVIGEMMLGLVIFLDIDVENINPKKYLSLNLVLCIKICLGIAIKVMNENLQHLCFHLNDCGEELFGQFNYSCFS